MQRTAAVVLTLVLASGLAACGDDDDVATENPTEVPATEAPATEEPTEAPATEEPATPAPGGPSFDWTTTDWGCGYGFRASNADQTGGLFIELRQPDVGAAAQVPAVGNVPTEIWDGYVSFGTDLFANWCDDVIEEGEPLPAETDRWSLVAGNLELVGDQATGQCAGASLELVATGLVADGPDGEVSLPDVTLTNPAWGCFAG
jgi:hypothetical protein